MEYISIEIVIICGTFDLWIEILFQICEKKKMLQGVKYYCAVYVF